MKTRNFRVRSRISKGLQGFRGTRQSANSAFLAFFDRYVTSLRSSFRTRIARIRSNRTTVWLAVGLLGAGAAPAPRECRAGASQSQWVLVVNGNSVSSRTVANHFCQIRDIPSANVIVLYEVPDQDRISLEEFKRLILIPTLEQIQERRLANHVQGIAYSTDFPTAIDVAEDAQRLPKASKLLTPTGSINGLTYFYRHLLAGVPNYLSLEANNYASRSGQLLFKPVLGSPEQVKQLEVSLNSQAWDEAANVLQSGAEGLPSEIRSPMRILEAQLRMKAGSHELAHSSIQKAISDGWSYRAPLEDELFAPIQAQLGSDSTLAKLSDTPFDYTPFRGFDARTNYAINSMVSPDKKFGVNYMLSVVLGVTRDFGITRFEVIEGLRRSARADFHPIEGTFLFSKTADVRTTARSSNFVSTIERLRMKGYEARMIATNLPQQKESVAGLMVGAPALSLSASGTELMPGAIADNLTSFGGAMTNPSQTKATEFIRNGAAGSSGTVTEPYALQNKFPHPMIHDAYTDGLTLAEAFYGNVLSPYQLLILGDPLCQPFARPPKFTAKIQNPKVVSDKGVTIAIESETPGEDIVSLTLTLDGVYIGEIPFKPQVTMDLSTVPSGWHELRLIAKGQAPVEPRYEQKINFEVTVRDQKYGKLNWSCSPPKDRSNRKIVTFDAQGTVPGQELEIWLNHELYTTVPYGGSEFEIDYKTAGHGPARFQLRQRIDERKSVASNIEVLEVN